MVTGTNLVLTMLYKCRVIFIIENCQVILIMMVTGTNLVLTMLYKCRVIFITMVTVTNLVLKLDQNLELLSYLDNDDHWNQFGTTDYHAKEV